MRAARFYFFIIFAFNIIETLKMTELPTQISFTSYKRFPGTERLQLRPITLLLGKNSSGKSSVIKLMLSLSQALSGAFSRAGIPFRGEGYSLGTSFQHLCHNGNMFDMEVGIGFDNVSVNASLMTSLSGEMVINRYVLQTSDNRIDARLEKDGSYDVNGQSDVHLTFNGLVCGQLLSAVGLDALPHFKMDYIGPLRTSPNRTWYISDLSLQNWSAEGKQAYQLLYENEEVLKKTSEWFYSNMDNCKIDIVRGDEAGSFRVVISRPENEDYKVNIADVGMGIIQVLPIVVKALSGNENTVIGIEQPELHLHPAAHASIARLLAKTSLSGNRKYIVETHSENFLLGLREMIVDPQSDFTSEDVIIYFIDEDSRGAYIRPITINADGSLSDWPTGVFNESYDLLMSIKRKSQR